MATNELSTMEESNDVLKNSWEDLTDDLDCMEKKSVTCLILFIRCYY